MMAAGALAEPLGNGESGWRVCRRRGRKGWLGWGGWMEEGGQAERSTRGGLRGPRGPRGEKLEKGRFKYQPPRGGPRARCLYLAAFLPSRAPLPTSSLRSLTRHPPRCHPLATLRRSSLMHTHIHAHTKRERERELRTERYVHRQTLTHTHLSILGQRKGVLEPFDVGGRR